MLWKKKEFDKFAEEYDKLHQKNIKLSGEYPEFFHEYKIKDLKIIAKKEKLPENSQILDFGCGIGNSIGIMKTYFQTPQYMELIFLRKALLLLKSALGNLQSFNLMMESPYLMLILNLILYLLLVYFIIFRK